MKLAIAIETVRKSGNDDRYGFCLSSRVGGLDTAGLFLVVSTRLVLAKIFLGKQIGEFSRINLVPNKHSYPKNEDPGLKVIFFFACNKTASFK